MKFNEKGAMMPCAYCGKKLPWDREHFPSAIYAECATCRSLSDAREDSLRWWQLRRKKALRRQGDTALRLLDQSPLSAAIDEGIAEGIRQASSVVINATQEAMEDQHREAMEYQRRLADEMVRLRSYEPCDPCKRDDHDNCTGDCPSMCCALAAHERMGETFVQAAGTTEKTGDEISDALRINLNIDGQDIRDHEATLPYLQAMGALHQRTVASPVTSAWDRLMAFAQAVEAGVLLEADPKSGKWLLSVSNWNLRKVEVENGAQAVTCLQRKLEEWDAERASSSAASKDRSDRIRKALGS